MNAEIVAIGSELLLGQIVDSNSAWISKRLAENGINLFYKTIVGDNPERMDYILSNHCLGRYCNHVWRNRANKTILLETLLQKLLEKNWFPTKNHLIT